MVAVVVGAGIVQARLERRRVIVAAASGLFAACGYRAASMEEIACRAGISKPVLYKAFSSKLELYLAVLLEAEQILADTLIAALARAEDVESIVTATVAAVFDFADLHARSAALLAGAAVAEEPAAQRAAYRAAAACTATLMDALVPPPLSRTEQGWLIATEIIAIAQSCARDWAVIGKPLPKSEAVATTAGLCWAGLGGVRLAAPELSGHLDDREPISEP